MHIWQSAPFYSYILPDFEWPSEQIRQDICSHNDATIFDKRVRYSLAMFVLYMTGRIGKTENPFYIKTLEEERVCTLLHALDLTALSTPTKRRTKKQFVSSAYKRRLMCTENRDLAYYRLECPANKMDLSRYDRFGYWGNIPAIQMQETMFLFGKPLHEYLNKSALERYTDINMIHLRQSFNDQYFDKLLKKHAEQQKKKQYPTRPPESDVFFFAWIMSVLQLMADEMLWTIDSLISEVDNLV